MSAGSGFKRLRLLLLPFGAVAELTVLAVCWTLALTSPARAEKLMWLAMAKLPTIHWYIGE